MVGSPVSRKVGSGVATVSVIAVASSKGGAGKTTVAEVLLGALAERGATVAAIDADFNQTLSKWVQTFSSYPITATVEIDETKIVPLAGELADRHDVVVIDTAGAATQATVFAIGCADLVIVPVQLSSSDVVEAIKTVLDASPDGPCLAVENMAGMGQHIGAKFDELGGILDAVNSPRLKICLDTQHSFAAGYDLTNPQGIQAMLDELDAGPGSENVAAVHANDSKRVCGSGVDRHDNIGDGFIGEEGFAAIMANPAFADVPFLLEVPGFEGKGPDQQNINILKKIRSQVGLSS